MDCDGEPNLDSGDINDNEYITMADVLMLFASDRQGDPEISAPKTCASDPTDTRRGFDRVDPNYEVVAKVEVTNALVEIDLKIRTPGLAQATTLSVEFPNTLSDPTFIFANGLSDGGESTVNVLGNYAIVHVQGRSEPGRAGVVLPGRDSTTGLIHLGKLCFKNSGESACPAVSFVPEHTFGGASYRATIVDEDFLDHHPSFSVSCRQGLEFVRGDANGDGSTNIADSVKIFGWLFQGDDPPMCLDAADVDDKGDHNLTDALYLLAFLFQGGPPPSAPGPGDCGSDETCDLTGCAGYSQCP